MNKESIEKLVEERQELKFKLREIDRELTDTVLNFDGTVQDALRAGLIRLNFPAPSGFYRYLRTDRK